jgi:hypothetical protein
MPVIAATPPLKCNCGGEEFEHFQTDALVERRISGTSDHELWARVCANCKQVTLWAGPIED